MPQEVYEVVSQGARYWFLFLMAVIAWRSYRWYAKDRKQRKKRLRLLPDAGYIGELVVQRGNAELPENMALPVSREGIIGSHRGCDVFLPAKDVASKHLWFRHQPGEGILVRAFVRKTATADEEKVDWRSKTFLLHGSRLSVGEVELRLRMFAGFEEGAPRAAQPAERSAEPMVGEPEGQLTEEQRAILEQLWLLEQEAYAVEEAEPLTEQYGSAEDYEAEAYVFEEEPYPAAEQQPAPTRSLFSPFAPAEEALEPLAPATQWETVFPAETFYPPVGSDEQADDWPYAEYPTHDDEISEPRYSRYGGRDIEDEDLTDAAAPSKSMYVEPDDSFRAKQLLWDRYLGGGKKR